MQGTYKSDWRDIAAETAITDRHFGMNLVANKNFIAKGSAFEKALNAFAPPSIRYPGGTVTENYFDPTSSFFSEVFDETDSDTVLHSSGDRVATVRSVMDYASESNSTVDFVLPTEHLLNTSSQGESIIDEVALSKLMARVNGLISGEYGGARIGTFEIGNEYYVNQRIAPDDYGMVANRLIEELSVSFEKFGSRVDDMLEWDRPDIAVQAGVPWLPSDNDKIIAAISEDSRAEVDVVIGHFYPKRLENIENYSRFFNGLNSWQNTPGFGDVDIWISEWNIKNSTDSDHGLYQASSLISAFQEMTENGVDAASVWGAQHSVLDSKLMFLRGTADRGETDYQTDMTAAGYIFHELSDNLIGLKSLNIEKEAIVEIDNPKNVDVQAFGNGDRAVIYISSRSDTLEDATLNISEYFYGSSHVSAKLISAIDDPRTEGVDESQPDSPLARFGVTGVSEKELTDDAGEITLKPGEIVQLEVNFAKTGVDLEGFDPLDPISGPHFDDNFVGSNFSDKISGNIGEDTLFGSKGIDLLYGGDGSDRVSGGGGNDVAFGGDGDDIAYGGTGNDTTRGGGGDDKMFGGSGNDRLDGGSGKDQLKGGDGDDTLLSMDGSNHLTGGTGGDLFLLSVDANTVVKDFNETEGDTFSFLGFYDEQLKITEFISVVENERSGSSDIVISHETGFTTKFVGIGKGVSALLEKNADILYPGKSAISLSDTLNSMDPQQISAFMSNLSSDEYEEQVSQVDQNILFANLEGDTAAHFLNNLDKNDFLEFLDGISDSAFRLFANSADSTGLGDFSKALHSGKLAYIQATVPDDVLADIDAVLDLTSKKLVDPSVNNEETDDIMKILSKDMDKDKNTFSSEVEDEDEFIENSDCFVASAAYRNRAHSNVTFLREYRTNVLEFSGIGRIFINLYWWLGPKAAKFVYRSPLLASVSRSSIELIVKILKQVYGENTK